jgi:hypothetical protein
MRQDRGVVELAVVPGYSLGPVVVGTGVAAVMATLGDPSVRRPAASGAGASLWWRDPSLRVDLDAEGLVEFCEVTFVGSGPLVIFGGVDLLGLPAAQVAEMLTSTLGGDYEEGGYSFISPSGLALWRPVLPSEAGDANPDDRQGAYWRTVGVAAVGYW